MHVPNGTPYPSDHYPITFDIEISPQLKKTNRTYKYDFKHADFDSINRALLSLPLSAGIYQAQSQKEFD